MDQSRYPRPETACVESRELLRVEDGLLDWDAIDDTPIVIEKWGRKDSELAADYYKKS